jgi:hypothetical protein
MQIEEMKHLENLYYNFDWDAFNERQTKSNLKEDEFILHEVLDYLENGIDVKD